MSRGYCTDEELVRAQAVFEMQAFFEEPGSGARVFIGPVAAARNRKLLEAHGVKSVLAANTSPAWFAGDLEYLILNAEDDDSEDLLSRLDACCQWIDQALQRGSVLVHCTAGVSRSATVAIAFLMRRLRCGCDRAHTLLAAKRRWVRPNSGFQRQLRYFEAVVLLRNPLRWPLTGGEEDDSEEKGGNQDAIDRSSGKKRPVDCELCALEKRTKWLSEDEKFVVLICDQCDNPMVVYRKHTMQLSRELRLEMYGALASVANRFFAESSSDWFLDCLQRTVSGHIHWHARRIDGAKPVWLDGFQKHMISYIDDSPSSFSSPNPSSAVSSSIVSDRVLLGSVIPSLFPPQLVVAHWQYMPPDPLIPLGAQHRIVAIHDQWMETSFQFDPSRSFQVILIHCQGLGTASLTIGGFDPVLKAKYYDQTTIKKLSSRL